MTSLELSAMSSGGATGEKLEIFLHWFKEHGGYVHDSVEFVYSPDKGVHMRVKRASSSEEKLSSGRLINGTRIVSCPHALTFSALNVLGHCELLPRSKDHALEIGKELEALPQDLLGKARPQCVAAFGLAVQRLAGHGSAWYSYLDLLPLPPSALSTSPNNHTDPGNCEIDSPLWWSETERSWLKDTTLEKGVVDLESFWLREWDEWKGIVVPWAAERGLKLTW